MPDKLKGRSRVSSHTVSVSLYERDLQLLNQLSEFYGCSRSEAVRTAIRATSVIFRTAGSGKLNP